MARGCPPRAQARRLAARVEDVTNGSQVGARTTPGGEGSGTAGAAAALAISAAAKTWRGCDRHGCRWGGAAPARPRPPASAWSGGEGPGPAASCRSREPRRCRVDPGTAGGDRGLAPAPISAVAMALDRGRCRISARAQTELQYPTQRLLQPIRVIRGPSPRLTIPRPPPAGGRLTDAHSSHPLPPRRPCCHARRRRVGPVPARTSAARTRSSRRRWRWAG